VPLSIWRAIAYVHYMTDTRKPAPDCQTMTEDIIVKVLARAHEAGLSPQIAEPIWREMMKQCIAYEFRVWDGEAE